VTIFDRLLRCFQSSSAASKKQCGIIDALSVKKQMQRNAQWYRNYQKEVVISNTVKHVGHVGAPTLSERSHFRLK
jgi:hypothetical protein